MWKLSRDNFDSIKKEISNNEYSAGNGSLMRCLPISLRYSRRRDPDLIVKLSIAQSKATHFHDFCSIACSVYNLILYSIFNNDHLSFNDHLNFAITYAETKIAPDTYSKRNFTRFLDFQIKKESTGTGFVNDCFWSSIRAIQQTKNYQEAMEFCVRLGNDTDTTACVCGGIAGALYGFDSLNKEWLDKISERPLIDKLFFGI